MDDSLTMARLRARFSRWPRRLRPRSFLPYVVLGSLIYWPLALGLGSMSLTILGIAAEDLDLVPQHELLWVDLRSGEGECAAPSGAGGESPASNPADDGTAEPPLPPEQTDSIGRTAY